MPAARGRFKPKHPEKYVGDVSKILFRSSWELHCMKYFDSTPSIKRWASEEISIAYISPFDMKVHQYFPDFIVTYENNKGEIKKELLEIKPLHESDPKKAKSDRSKEALKVNDAKWKAAQTFCEENNMTFRVLTEISLFHQKEKKPRKKKVKSDA